MNKISIFRAFDMRLSCMLVATGVGIFLSACQPASRIGPNRDASTNVGQISLHDGQKVYFTLGELGIGGSAGQVWAESCAKDLTLNAFLRTPVFQSAIREGQEIVGSVAVEKARAEAARGAKLPGACAKMKQRIIADPTVNKFLDPRRG